LISQRDEVLRITIFVLISVGIFRFSRDSLKDIRSYGFYRFFAFEALLGLFLLNVLHWFRSALSINQVISWFLLIASLYMVINGFYLLREVGRPAGDIKSTTNLVRVGVYRYIRHPLYSSLLLFGWGVFFKHPSIPGATLVLVVSIALLATAKLEERENLEKFGSDYAAYMETTKMFIPYLW
jgi:protein-S-isoprenylcysteine O-methyltransferase Ste14